MDYPLRGRIPLLRRASRGALGERPSSARRTSESVERWRGRTLKPTPATALSSRAVAVPGSARHIGGRPWVRWCTVRHSGHPGRITSRDTRLRKSIWPRIWGSAPLGLLLEGTRGDSPSGRQNCHTARVWKHDQRMVPRDTALSWSGSTLRYHCE